MNKRGRKPKINSSINEVQSKEIDKEEIQINDLGNGFEEIIYANGHKFTAPKLHNCVAVIDKNLLPNRPRQGYYRVWLVDRQPMADLMPYLQVGFRPVAGESPRWAGSKQNGEPYFHILHEIPLEQHEKIIAEKNNLNNQKLYSQLVSVPDTIYGPGRVPYVKFTMDRR